MSIADSSSRQRRAFLIAVVMISLGSVAMLGDDREHWRVSYFLGTRGGGFVQDGVGEEARFEYPQQLTVGADGYIYVLDGAVLRRLGPDRSVETLSSYRVGTSTGPSIAAADDGRIFVAGGGYLAVFDPRHPSPARWMSTRTLADLAFKNGKLYGLDYATGRDVLVFLDADWDAAQAGTPQKVIHSDTSRLRSIAFDDHGNLAATADDCNVYLATPSFPDQAILQAVTSWHCGPGYPFDSPRGMAAAPDGSLVITDASRAVVKRMTTQDSVSIVAGNEGFFGMSDGFKEAARFRVPVGVDVGLDGTIWVADTASQLIRRITPDGYVETWAGKTGRVGNDDGPLDRASLLSPSSLVVLPSGELVVFQPQGKLPNTPVLRVINPSIGVSTLNTDLTFDNIVQVQRLDDDSILLRGATAAWRFRIGEAPQKLFDWQKGDTAVVAGNGGAVYVANGAVVFRVDSSGHRTPFLSPVLIGDSRGSITSMVSLPDGGFAVGWNARLCFFYPDGGLRKVVGSFIGFQDGSASTAMFRWLAAMAVFDDQSLVVVDYSGSILEGAVVRRVSMDGDVTTIAGDPKVAGDAVGRGDEARFFPAWSIGVDRRTGTIYFPMAGLDSIRTIRHETNRKHAVRP